MEQVALALAQLGGVASHGELTDVVSRRQVAAARSRGDIARDRRGRYVLPAVPGQRRVAHELTATLSHTSAALHYGWKVKDVPERAYLVVPRNRNVSRVDQARAEVRWRDLVAEDISCGVTRPMRTVLDCARDLPFDQALCVADSALRDGAVGHEALRRLAAALRGPGGRQARTVAAHASYVAANPFESVLRAIALQVPGLHLQPQLRVWDRGLFATVDLGDESLKLALEADGWSEHGGRKAFRKDCRRYDELVAWGWTVFRFTWEDVMLQPEFVRWCLESWLRSRAGGAVQPPPPVPARLH